MTSPRPPILTPRLTYPEDERGQFIAEGNEHGRRSLATAQKESG
jgi:hypothetical protein